MREKIKSHKTRTILIASMVVIITISICVFAFYNNKTSLNNSNIDKEDKVNTELNSSKENIDLDEKVEEKGEESTTEESKTEVSNTPKIEDDKKSNNTTNNSNSNANSDSKNNSQTTQKTDTTKQEEVVNNNSNSSSNSTNQKQETESSKNEEKPVVDKQPETESKVEENNTEDNNFKTDKQVWEELGITEYDYYNSPMMSWQKVTHSTFEECQSEGDRVLADGNSEYTTYWCYQVNSYSGRMLGVMLSLK